MCQMCAVVVTTTPGCAFEAPNRTPIRAEITEVIDAAAETGTNYSMGVGDSFSGNISYFGDRDAVRIELAAGQSYSFSLLGSPTGNGTLTDTFLRLYDSSGTQLRSNDDSGGGVNSLIRFTAASSGTHYLEAAGYDASLTGTYQLQAVEVAPPAAGTMDELADYLVNGYWSDGGGSGGRFDTSASNVITVNLTALTATGRQMARWAMEAWSAAANLVFSETNGQAMMTLDDNQSGAFANFQTAGDFITSATINVSTQWITDNGDTIDSYTLQTYIHEFGHALGLGHQGNYNGNATYGTDETFSNDSWQVSIMSYFTQTENTTTGASYGLAMTAMMSDLIAMHSMYGASTQRAGATIYGLNHNLTGYMGELMTSMVTNAATANVARTEEIAFTIHDSGGTDLIDVSFSTESQRVNLAPESFSDIVGRIGNMGIGRGSVIENAITGTGNDTILGNDAANDLRSGTGNDSVEGGAGSDSIRGSDGNDRLYGGSSGDLIYGGNNRDTIEGGSSSDTIYGGAGNDSINSGSSADTVYGGSENDLIYGDSNADWLYGGDNQDTLYGGTSGDTIYGGSSSDRLYGDEGNDDLDGGSSADTIYGGDGNDVVDGDTSADSLYGGASEDTLIGGSNNDTLYGGSGSDSLTGDTGSDVFVFSTAIGTSIDRITDFTVIDDTIWLEAADFARLAAGALGALAFVSNTSGQATTGSLRLIYESDNGALYYDADGSGDGARVQFATLSAGLALTAADFLVI